MRNNNEATAAATVLSSILGSSFGQVLSLGDKRVSIKRLPLKYSTRLPCSTAERTFTPSGERKYVANFFIPLSDSYISGKAVDDMTTTQSNKSNTSNE